MAPTKYPVCRGHDSQADQNGIEGILAACGPRGQRTGKRRAPSSEKGPRPSSVGPISFPPAGPHPGLDRWSRQPRWSALERLPWRGHQRAHVAGQRKRGAWRYYGSIELGDAPARGELDFRMGTRGNGFTSTTTTSGPVVPQRTIKPARSRSERAGSAVCMIDTTSGPARRFGVRTKRQFPVPAVCGPARWASRDVTS
jgi:hypothetical protein